MKVGLGRLQEEGKGRDESRARSLGRVRSPSCRYVVGSQVVCLSEVCCGRGEGGREAYV